MNNDRILLIEDDKESAYLIKRLLMRLGYEEEDNIIICHSLAEMSSIQDTDIDIILTDLTLPDSDFEKTFERVYTNFPHVPIIVLTGKDESDFAVKTINQGAQDYLIKGSFGQDILQKSIQYAVERKKTRNELERSHADFRRVFEESPNPMFIFERHTYRILEVNIAAIRQYGYTKSELLAVSMADIRPEEDKQMFYEILHTLTEQYMDAGQWRHLRKDGSVKHVQVYSHTTRFNDIDAVVSMMINVDEKVQVKERLRERNKEITDILDAISDGFYTVNRDWMITYVNAAFESIFKTSKENTTGSLMWECFPRFKDTSIHKEMQATMDGAPTYHSTIFSPTAEKWLSISAYPIKDGLAIYLLDINEEHQLQEQLLNNDKTLRAIINNTHDVIWSMDRSLNIIEANQAFWDRVKLLTGKNEKDIRKDVLRHEAFSIWNTYFDRAFSGESYKTTWTEETTNGTTYQDISFNPIFDDDHKVTGISCFSRDITAEVNYLRQIEEQNEQLKEIAWLQSHKVRSHVATILGLSQFVNKQAITDPDLNKVLNGITDAAKELDSVIKEINSLTRNTAV